MTRSLGDSIAKRLGCSSIPSIKSVNLRKLDNFIILGSDGI